VVLLGGDTFSRRLAEELSERLEAGLAAASGQRARPLDRPGQDPGWTQAVAALEAGREAYLDMDAELATASLRKAIEGMRRAGDALVQVEGRRDYLDALLTLGAAEILAGEPARGQATFARALAAEQGLRLDPATFPPELVHAFAAVRAEVEARPRGGLFVYATPDLARVWVDGRFRCVTPCEVTGLVAGAHLVWVRRLGHAGQGEVVEIEAGGRRELTLRLEPADDAPALAEALRAAPGGLPGAGGEALAAWASRLGLERVLVGRLDQAGAGFVLRAAWLEADTGRWGGERSLGLRGLPESGSPALAALVSSLRSPEGGVLESPGPGAQPGAIALRDEARFVEAERPWWERWYVWTGVGAGVLLVAGAIVLGVLLSGDDGPGSHFVLEF